MARPVRNKSVRTQKSEAPPPVLVVAPGLVRIGAVSASMMEGSFRTRDAMYRALATNPVTWKQVTVGVGAKESTVKSIAMNFIHLLYELHNNGFVTTNKDIYVLIAKRIYEEHASLIERGNWEALIRP